ncbi:MAG TPA: hypothetical protein VMT18_00460 [Planctomycetota bacterium]|nr:hypothetical protein [Planctomycetota bacterium]
MSSFAPLARALARSGARYILIGVSGANVHAHRAGIVFGTQDRDVFLPPDADNLLRAWQACESCGLELSTGSEPLDRPRDLLLARRIVEARARTLATDDSDLQVDLTLVMTGFVFDDVWSERTTFRLEGVDVPVARLRHIVVSKAAAGRPKDQLFLTTHEEALRELLGPDASHGP